MIAVIETNKQKKKQKKQKKHQPTEKKLTPLPCKIKARNA